MADKGGMTDAFALAQARQGVQAVCITKDGRPGSRLLGIVTSRDTDFVNDRLTPLADVMTTCEPASRTPVKPALKHVHGRPSLLGSICTGDQACSEASAWEPSGLEAAVLTVWKSRLMRCQHASFCAGMWKQQRRAAARRRPCSSCSAASARACLW
jgi:hypothetical protein